MLLRLLACTCFLFVVNATSAAKRYSFEPSHEAKGQRLELVGTGHFQYWWFGLYDGALYLLPGSDGKGALEAVPKRLELAYFRKIPGAKLVEAGQGILAKNATPAELASIADGLDAINAAYRDVEEGDRYSLTFIPGVGTTLALNNDPLVTVEGDDFARIYFRLWFGPQPVDPKFRDALMGS